MSQYREEKDSMGPVRIPADMLYGAQTERARQNFPISRLRFDRRFLYALGVIKRAAAEVNEDLSVSVKDQIVGILAYGATPVSSVEGFLHGKERRSVGEVIGAYPDLFEVFARGFPETGPKRLWRTA